MSSLLRCTFSVTLPVLAVGPEGVVALVDVVAPADLSPGLAFPCRAADRLVAVVARGLCPIYLALSQLALLETLHQLGSFRPTIIRDV